MHIKQCKNTCLQMMRLSANKALFVFNSFASIRACRPWQVIRGRTWLAGVLLLLLFPNAFAESDFSAFLEEI